MDRLLSFLRRARLEIGKAGCQFVSGNPSADLDSTLGAILFAFLLHCSNPSHTFIPLTRSTPQLTLSNP
jgi:hypothetical protein